MENKTVLRTLGMLGLAMRAGRLTLGTELICRAMPKRIPKLVIVSSAASEATKKKLRTKSEFYGIEMRVISVDMDELGRTLGKTYAPAALSVNDTGFAEQIIKLLDGAELNSAEHNENGEAQDNGKENSASEQILRKEVSDIGNGD